MDIDAVIEHFDAKGIPAICVLDGFTGKPIWLSVHREDRLDSYPIDNEGKINDFER